MSISFDSEKHLEDFVYLYDNCDISIYDIGVSLDDGFQSELVGEGWFNKGQDRRVLRKAIKEIRNG